MKQTDTSIDGKKLKTHSVRAEISAVFILTMLVTFGLWFVINILFLERFYVQKKKENIIEAYEIVVSAVANDNIESLEFESYMRNLCERYNIDMVVCDSDTKVIKSVSSNNQLVNVLVDCLMKNINPALIKKMVDEEHIVLSQGTYGGNEYTLQKSIDNANGSEYIDIWGIAKKTDDINTNVIFIRSKMESIEDSVTISNKFMAYVGVVALCIGSMLVLIISKKVTAPIKKLYLISDEMKKLNFEAKYENSSDYKNEIDVLGQNMNELSETLETSIKDLKNANIALKHDIAKKEEIDEMRKEFLSNVSHELKTPIALIQGYAEGLKEGINDDEENRNFYCEVIMDEASKMNIMVKKLLTLNQLEFGNESANMERFDIVEMVKNYIRSAELLAKQKDVTVKFGDYHPIFVWGDEFKIEEVLQNYYSNAINHVSGDNIIEIKLVHKDGKVRVSVFNTGESIPKENIDYIWDKFYKVDKARTREYGGSGVGLSIVKAIMESMQQDYGVINYANGVEFYFELETK